jgi:hypothetical protein
MKERRIRTINQELQVNEANLFLIGCRIQTSKEKIDNLLKKEFYGKRTNNNKS